MRFLRWSPKRADPAAAAGDAADDEMARPYLDLAREIRAEVSRIASDPSAQGRSVVEYIEGLPREQRMELAARVFADLPAERQWAVLEAAYGDEAIRAYLVDERQAHLAQLRATGARSARARAARAARRLDTADLERDELLTLGLFREEDVRAALSRGRASSACARRVVLVAAGGGGLRVIEDVFNPSGGYFVTAAYTEDTWRRHDRLASHSLVRVGSIAVSAEGSRFEPAVFPGGRVDVEVQGRAVPGLLHLGFAILGDVDVFAD